MKVVIVGGVAGGAGTAAKLRRNNEDLEIIMFERGPDISFANCGMPYYLGDIIKDRDNLNVVSKDYFKDLLKVDVRINSEVIALDVKDQKVKVLDLETNHSYFESYDYLVLSPGGYPIIPEVEGILNDKTFVLRNLEDMDQIKLYIENYQPKRAVVVGGGFIGLEVAENLAHKKIATTVIEKAGQVMNILDPEISAYLAQELNRHGVSLYLNNEIKQLVNADTLSLELLGGEKLETDMLILAIGVKPESKLAQEAGIKTTQSGAIEVDETMQTSLPRVYALGDAVEVMEIVSKTKRLIPLANSANKQARIVADNICGKKKTYFGTAGSSILKVFNLSAGMTGLSEKVLARTKLSYQKVYLVPGSSAAYYPGSFPLTCKLLYSPLDGKILGAQIVGRNGVDKRIDVLTAMLFADKTVYDLAELELSYAPPYNSAKDPINLAGMIAINQIEGKNVSIFWDELLEKQALGALIVDVRTPLEYELNHLEGAINIPATEIRERSKELALDKEIILYCNQGKTAYFAFRILQNLGFKRIYNLAGGIKLFNVAITKKSSYSCQMEESGFENCISVPHNVSKKVDACGLQCPGPILKLYKEMQLLAPGEQIEITASDPGFLKDAQVWAEKTNNKIVAITEDQGIITAIMEKGIELQEAKMGINNYNDKTIVVFSGDLDKAIAAFIIANGAAAMGRKVTMFFTFWGLNVLRQNKQISLKKSFIERMFGKMMPRGSKSLGLSRMNMFGMGAKMIRAVMKIKNVDQLESMIKTALEAGVNIIACQMSMDIMGLKKEELLSGVQIAGVATYLGAAETSDTNLFI